jgi:hypothetical protein
VIAVDFPPLLKELKKMSWILFIVTLAAFTAIFSEFGGKLRASSAIGWWLIACFLLTAAVAPSLLMPVTHALGITLVSNFVMATTIVFLFLQVFSLSALQTGEARKIRATVSKLAAESFVSSNPHVKGTGARKPSALIVLPCYNEEGSVPLMVPQLESLKRRSSWAIDYCFVDDGSTDRTRQLLGEIAPQNFVPHLVNNNVSGVLMTGFQIALLAGFDYAVQCDGDGQHPVSEIERLLEEAQAHDADLLIASRFASNGTNGDTLASTTLLRRSGSLILIGVLRSLWPGLQCSDPTSGFRVYSRKTCMHLLTHMPDEFPEPEAIAIATVAGLKVVETSVKMEKRLAGLSSIRGLKTFIYMYKAISALVGLRLRTLRR